MGIFPPFLAVLTEVSLKRVGDEAETPPKNDQVAHLVPKAKENRIRRRSEQDKIYYALFLPFSSHATRDQDDYLVSVFDQNIYICSPQVYLYP